MDFDTRHRGFRGGSGGFRVEARVITRILKVGHRRGHPAFRVEDNMGTWGALDVEPEVLGMSELEGQAIVGASILSNPNGDGRLPTGENFGIDRIGHHKKYADLNRWFAIIF